MEKANKDAPHHHEEVHLLDYVNVILRRRKIFLLTLALVFFGVALVTFTMDPVYEAVATLHVKDERGKAGLLGELALALDTVNPINAEVEILKSRTLAEQVVKRLHLDWHVSRKPADLAFRLLEFSSTARKPSYRIELTGPNTYTVRDDSGGVAGTGQGGTLMQGKGVTLLIGELNGKSGDGFQLDLLPFKAVAADLQGAITSKEVGKLTNIVKLSYQDSDPERARDVVNTLVQAYLGQNIAFKAEEASRTVDFVEEQLHGLRKDLDDAERNLQAYKTSSGVVKLDTEAEALVKNLSETERERAGVALQKKQAEFALASLKDAMRRGAVYSPAVMREDPLVAGLTAKLSELAVQKRALLAEATESLPAVKAVQEQIDEVQKKVRDTYDTALKNLGRQETEVTRQLSRYEGRLKALPVAERELARLTRHAKVNAEIYTLLLQKREEARIAKASAISNIRVVDPAITPDFPVKPQKAKNLILALLVGCMLGAGLAFFREYLDNTIKDIEQARRVLGVPVLAAIPYIARKEGERKSEIRETLVTHLEPKSIAAEAYRSLRTALHFSALPGKHQVTLVTSTFPDEGKSTTVSNLAITISHSGTRVLLVDCDLRRPILHDIFGRGKAPGLTDLLAGECDMASALQATEITGVDLLSAGTTPPNPAELLGSDAMRRLLASLKERYDLILIDAPPVLTVTDAPLLTAAADMVLVVVEAGRVPVKAARRMKEMLATVNAPLTGVVMNIKSGERFDHYSDYYYLAGYGSPEEGAASKGAGWKKWLKR